VSQRAKIIGSIALLLTISFGIYLFTRGSEYENLIDKKTELEKDLLAAQEKLKAEEDKLNQMLEDLQNSFQLSFAIQDQMQLALSLITQTDFLFEDAYGQNPNSFLGTSLINQRKDINFLLSQWQKQLGILGLGNIDKTSSAKIRQDAERIKQFFQSLAGTISGLTPGNSGLTQEQIDAYLSQLPTTGQINEIINSIDDAIENLNNSENPTVTPEQVVAQQEVVDDAREEVEEIEEELEEIEEQIEEEYPYPTPAEVPEEYATPAYETPAQGYSYPTPEAYSTPSQSYSYQSPETYTGGETLPYYPTPYSRAKYPGIIVQPGPPQLIPGSDPY